jgi:hypothetical protein
VLAAALLAPAGRASADGVAELDPSERELFCALGGDAYLANRAWPTRAELREAEVALDEVDVELCMARFEEALELAAGVRARLEELPASRALARRRAQLEALAATAHVALGDDAAGRTAFARAIELDRGFELDARRASPKLLRVYREARDEAARKVAAR